MEKLKRWIPALLLALFLPLPSAAERADTTYTFRFVPRKYVFFISD